MKIYNVKLVITEMVIRGPPKLCRNLIGQYPAREFNHYTIDALGWVGLGVTTGRGSKTRSTRRGWVSDQLVDDERLLQLSHCHRPTAGCHHIQNIPQLSNISASKLLLYLRFCYFYFLQSNVVCMNNYIFAHFLIAKL